MNKEIERFLIAACIAYLLGSVMAYGIQYFMNYLMESGYSMAYYGIIQGFGRILMSLPLSLVCGYWLMVVAKSEERNPLAWFLFGLMFQIVGVALFYAVVIYQNLKSLKIEQGSAGNVD